jgi:hypothetical protein
VGGKQIQENIFLHEKFLIISVKDDAVWKPSMRERLVEVSESKQKNTVLKTNSS